MAEASATSDRRRSGNRKPHVLILTSDLGGGTGNHLLSMMRRWDAREWDLEVVSTARRTSRHEVPGRLTMLAPPGPEVYPLHQLARLVQVGRLVGDRRPDLVHAYFFWSILYGRALRAAGRIHRLVENREDEGFNWGKHEYFWLRVTRGVPDRVICVSEAVRSVAIEREGLAPEKTKVIHNGIEPTEPPPGDRVDALRRELSIPTDAPVVGMVANLNRRVKGVDRFVAAMPMILREVPDARFVVLGRGAGLEPLRREVKRGGLGDRAILPGYREDVELFYGLFDVSVLTSFTEGLSITLLESMSHGLPVVATRVGGNPEVVEEGVTGYLVPPDRPEPFAERVVELLRRPGLRRRMGEAGKRRARTSFSLQDTAEQYAAVYREILAE